MAKKRKDGRYEKAVTINGKVVHFYGKTQKEITEKMLKYRKKERDGVLFGQLVDEWFEEFRREHPSSERAVKAHVKRLKTFLGRTPAKKITAKDMTTFFFLMDAYSRKTVQNCKSVAKLVFDHGIYAHGLTDNPVTYRKTLKGQRKTKREPPSPEEIEAIKNSINAPYGLFMVMALYTGMRRGELLRLQYGDIDREKNEIHVTKSVYHQNNQPIIKEPKTAAGTRTVILLEPLKAVLPEGAKNKYIFGGDKPWTAHETQRHLYAWQKATGLKVTPHQCRHRFATILYEAGIDDRMAMDLLGHRNIATTREIYTHISNSKRESTAEQLNEFLREKS